MAQRRMFSPQIIDSDAFLDMPSSAQSLYFHLGMRADDDGFVGNPKKIQKIIGSSEDDLKILLAKAFILTFESGIIVIKHWRINNLIRKDWYKETAYLEEKARLKVKENGAYSFSENENIVNENSTNLPHSLGKVSLGKVSLESSTPAEETRKFFTDYRERERIEDELIAKGLPKNIVLNETLKFISYWTEPTKSGKKQKWETQETFEIGRRLSTWFRNFDKFNEDRKVRVMPKIIREAK